MAAKKKTANKKATIKKATKKKPSATRKTTTKQFANAIRKAALSYPETIEDHPWGHSAFKVAKELLERNYNPDEWNVYLFHFSDGDNSSESDSRECCQTLKRSLLPMVNFFGYCQVASAYGSGNFINVLHEHLADEENVLTSRVNTKDDIYGSIKTFFSPGK